ncbi:MAG: acetyl-CoA carboxylase biotin carboxylase subunit, partial [Dehalococcoidia bacterium]
ELVTGLDLIHEQLKVASGEPLGFTQEDVKLSGWAIECRITAEDAEGGFLPSLGKVDLLLEPSGPGVRIDSSLFPGMEVSQFYDSLLSKAIAYGRDRDEALRRIRRALDEYEIMGVKTTLGFHRQLMAHPDFISGNIETHFLERSFNLERPAATAEDTALVVAALLSHARRNPGAQPAASGSGSNGKRSNWLTAGRTENLRDGGGASWRSIS